MFERLVPIRFRRFMERSGVLPTAQFANRKGLGAVMHFCACLIHCKVHWRVGRRLESCRLISVQPLIGSTIRAFSIGSALFLLYTSAFSSILENKLTGYADDSTSMAVVPSPGVRVPIAESLIRDHGRVGEWRDLWVMKLNASKTKTMIVFRSSTMHPQSPPLTIGWTVLKESDNIVILGWHLIPRWPLKSIFARFLEQLLKALVSLGSPVECSMIDRFLVDAFWVLSCSFWSTVLQCGARLPIHTFNYCTVQSVAPGF